MKKKRYSIITAAFLFLTAAVPTPATAFSLEDVSDESYNKCDVNSDGLVNGDDSLLILQRYVEIATGNDIISDQTIRDNIDKNADLYKDGVINGLDCSVLVLLIKEKNMVGDVNCDKVIDARDATAIMTYYTKQSTEYGMQQIGTIGVDHVISVLGDYDNNGIIDARDASALLSFYAKSSIT